MPRGKYTFLCTQLLLTRVSCLQFERFPFNSKLHAVTVLRTINSRTDFLKLLAVFPTNKKDFGGRILKAVPSCHKNKIA